jgi:hypothetical protein
MTRYLLADRYRVPRAVVLLFASWMAALALITVILLLIWVAGVWMPDHSHGWSPWFSIPVGLLGAYGAVGGVCLYFTMWGYWIVVERSSAGVRIGWLLALLFGVHYGALAYAVYIWRRKLQPISTNPSLEMGAVPRPSKDDGALHRI